MTEEYTNMTYAFIDASNIIYGAREEGWFIDQENIIFPKLSFTMVRILKVLKKKDSLKN